MKLRPGGNITALPRCIKITEILIRNNAIKLAKIAFEFATMVNKFHEWVHISPAAITSYGAFGTRLYQWNRSLIIELKVANTSFLLNREKG